VKGGKLVFILTFGITDVILGAKRWVD